MADPSAGQESAQASPDGAPRCRSGDARTGGRCDGAVALKLPTHGLVDHTLLPAAGIEFVLPTGDEERGIGSDQALGIGVSLPLTDDRDFDYAVNVMSIFHF